MGGVNWFAIEFWVLIALLVVILVVYAYRKMRGLPVIPGKSIMFGGE